MLYKSISHDLLQQHPSLCELLQRNRMLLSAVESCAASLKARQEALRAELGTTNPEIDPSQIASEALEIAVKELEQRLQIAFLPAGPGEPSLDEAMAFVQGLMSGG